MSFNLEEKDLPDEDLDDLDEDESIEPIEEIDPYDPSIDIEPPIEVPFDDEA
jgi:hypothetical protein